MLLVRYRQGAEPRPQSGLLVDEMITPIEGSVGRLLGLRVERLREALGGPGTGAAVPAAGVERLAPVDGLTEIWAAGVAYQRSRQARVAESVASADVYERVYDAERPELF